MKIIDNNLINYRKTTYDKVLFESYKCPLSPELMQSYRRRETHPKHDPYQSEIWAVGITVLCAALNSKIKKYYDWKEEKIKFKNIRKAEEQMREIGFSEQLISCIQGCLEESESRRSTHREMMAFLLPHQESIRKGEFGFNIVQEHHHTEP